MIYQRGQKDNKLVNLLFRQKVEKVNQNNQKDSQIKSISNSFHADQKSSKFYVCFNPCCSLPFSRVFKSDHSHHSQDACVNWILSDNQFQSYLENGGLQRGKMNESDVGKYSLNIGVKRMIQNICVFGSRKGMDWKKYYEGLFEELKQKLMRELKEMIGGWGQRMQGIRCQDTIANIQQLFVNIRGNRKNDVENRKQVEYIINEFISPLEGKVIVMKQPKVQDFSIVFKDLVDYENKQIFGEKSQVVSYQQIQRSRQEKDGIEGKQSKDEIVEFLLNCLSPFNKIQQVASLCGSKCEDFIFRGNMISLKCPFCEFRHSDKHRNLSNDRLKIAKKQIGMQVIGHLIKDHYGMIQQKYMLKYGRKKLGLLESRMNGIVGVFEITFDEFIKQMLQNDYKSLHIIDRESGITQIPEVSEDAYVLEVLSRSNMGQARSRCIITGDRKCTQFIMNYIAVYAGWIGNYVKNENIYFYSNSKDVNRFLEIVQVLERKPVERGGRDQGGVKREGLEMATKVRSHGNEGRQELIANKKVGQGGQEKGREGLKGIQRDVKGIKLEGNKG